MGSSTQIGRWFGIPIRVHITLWIVLPLIALNISGILQERYGLGAGAVLWAFLAAVSLFASVALHELGHSLVAIRKGCRVREILLLPIGGVAQLNRMPERPADEFQVAIAGPLVSLFLSGLFFALANGAAALGWVSFALVLGILSIWNLGLALFNLLPSFPMDGGRIFRAWMTPRVGRLEATRRAAKVGRFMALVFGIWALWPPFSLFLLLIAIFVYMAAGAEYRTVRIQEAFKHHQSGPWAPRRDWQEPVDREVTVSPPPYRRGRASSMLIRPVRMQHDMFDELFKNWH